MLVSWEEVLSEEINAQVHRLAQALASKHGIEALIPAYSSLLVRFNLLEVEAQELIPQIWRLAEEVLEKAREGEIGASISRIPVCYQAGLGPDLSSAAQYLGISEEELVRQHCQPQYHTYMIGFIPGFGYLGKLPFAKSIPRKQVPRDRVGEGSVGLAGWQTGIYPSQSSGGWQIIGKTPYQMAKFDGNRWHFRLQPGDKVQFFPISPEDWDEWAAKGRL